MAEMCIEKKRVGLKHVLNEVDVCPCRCSNLTLEKMKKKGSATIFWRYCGDCKHYHIITLGVYPHAF